MSIINSGHLSKIEKSVNPFLYKMETSTPLAPGESFITPTITIPADEFSFEINSFDIMWKIEIEFLHTNPVYGIQETRLLDLATVANKRIYKSSVSNLTTQNIRVKFTNIEETRTRNINSLYIWTNVEYNNILIELKSLIDIYKKELIRPKHTVLVQNKLMVAAGQTISNKDIFGETNPYLNNVDYLNVSDFSFIYFSVHTEVAGVDIKYFLQNWFFTSANFPENDFNGFSNAGKFTVASEPWLKVIDTTERYSRTGWLEVQGTHIWTYFKNEGPEGREFIISITGIR